MTTPSVRALKKRYPEARLSFLSEPLSAKVLQGNPYIDEIIIRDPKEGFLEPVKTIARVRAKKFDLVVDFLANPRTSLLTRLSGARCTISFAGGRRSGFYKVAVQPEGIFAASRKLSLLKPLGIEGESADLEMAVPERAKDYIHEWLEGAGLGARGPVVCHEPFPKWPVLTYPAEYHARLAAWMTERWNASVIICWGPGREDEARELIGKSQAPLLLAPRTDLHELAALYSRADLWVGTDGGPRHIAAARGLPTFAVMGPTGDAWTPIGRHLSFGRDELECRPCNQRYCPLDTHACMKELEPERVWEKLDQFKERLGQGDFTNEGDLMERAVSLAQARGKSPKGRKIKTKTSRASGKWRAK